MYGKILYTYNNGNMLGSARCELSDSSVHCIAINKIIV